MRASAKQVSAFVCQSNSDLHWTLDLHDDACAGCASSIGNESFCSTGSSPASLVASCRYAHTLLPNAGPSTKDLCDMQHIDLLFLASDTHECHSPACHSAVWTSDSTALSAGSALADQTKGVPLNNQTDGTEFGKTRANYPGLGDVRLACLRLLTACALLSCAAHFVLTHHSWCRSRAPPPKLTLEEDWMRQRPLVEAH